MTTGEQSRIEDTLRQAYADVLAAVSGDSTGTEVPRHIDPRRSRRGAGRPRGRSRWLVPASAGASVAVVALVAGLIIPAALQRPPPGAVPLHMAYVVSSSPGEVTPVNLVTGVALQSITTRAPGGVDGVASTPDGRNIYFDTWQGWAVTVDTVTHAVRRIWIGSHGGDLLISSDGSMGYVLQPPYGVAVVDFAQNKLVGFTKINGATQFALAPDGKSLYVLVAAPGLRQWRQFDGSTHGHSHADSPTADLPPANVVFGRAFGLAPDGKTLYVFGAVASGTNTTVLTPISTATNTALTPIQLGPAQYSGAISFSPDSRTAYIGGATMTTDSLTAVDLTTGAVRWATSVPDTGIYPATTTVAPDGQTIYAFTPDATPHTSVGTPALYQIAAATGIRHQIQARLVPTDRWFGDAVYVSPDSKTVYVEIVILTTNTDGTLGPAYASLAPTDAATGKASQSIKLPASGELVFGPP